MEKREHPQERIMTIEEKEELIVIGTTGIHIARACKGDRKKTIRVLWS